ncbi:MAG: hypothetical protein KAJ22_00785 [Candidatus Izimaplasma sp.]|nr:hypothetical protein [Candidatus Izimaplasma bacterium]
MKRILSLIITLTLVAAMFVLAMPSVAAEVTANDCTTNHTVVVHYHRWDDDYTNMDFWTWGTGTNGSGNPQIIGEDDFGAVAYFCIDDDSDAEAGLIPRLNDWSYKDGIDANDDGDTDNKSIPLKDANGDFDGFDENGIKHVYLLQGSASVYTAAPDMPFFQQEGFGTLVVIYFDPVESYDGWNMWNWGTGTDGTSAGDAFGGSGVPFQWDLGIDQEVNGGQFKVAVFNIAADADDTMGFIVRTDAWEKQFGDDLFIDISAIKGSGTQFTFYIGGAGEFYDSFNAFEAVVNLFEFTSVTALDRTSVEVVFNKDVVTKVDDIDVFDATQFMIADKDGHYLTIEQVSYDSSTNANDMFTLILETELSGDMSPYTVYYPNPDGIHYLVGEFNVDNTAPVITIIGSQNVELLLGDTYSLPTYSASDMIGDEAVVVYNVKVKDGHGTVDTRFAGIYEVVIVAEDAFGNTVEKTITVTVKDPCDDSAHLNAGNFNIELMALLIGLPLAFGAIITLRREY